jgi:hypothetical protein
MNFKYNTYDNKEYGIEDDCFFYIDTKISLSKIEKIVDAATWTCVFLDIYYGKEELSLLIYDSEDYIANENCLEEKENFLKIIAQLFPKIKIESKVAF